MAGSNAALGLLPIGTMNVFATELGLPAHDLKLCWNIIQGENTRLVDLPSANGKHFVQLAGVGLDAQVVKETSLTLKRNFERWLTLQRAIASSKTCTSRPITSRDRNPTSFRMSPSCGTRGGQSMPSRQTLSALSADGRQWNDRAIIGRKVSRCSVAPPSRHTSVQIRVMPGRSHLRS